MDPIRIILLVLHISAAAILVGASIGIVRNLKRSLDVGRTAFELATEDAARRSKLMGMCALLTLITGVILIFTIGGFGAAPLNFHMAFGVLLGAMAFSAVFMRPNTMALVKLAATDPVAKERALPHIKKLAMGQGILHLAWVVTLILMFVRIYK